MSNPDTTHSPKEKQEQLLDSLNNADTAILTQEDRQMLMELGFVASGNFLPWEAHALFGQLMLAEPQKAYGRVGLAYCKIMGGQFQDAHELLDSPIVEESGLKQYGIALRGLAFQLAKQPQELQALIEKNSIEMDAPEALQFIDHLVKLSTN